MNLEIIETTQADEALIRSLYQFYMYDFSEMVGFDVDSSGRFDESDLDGCWIDPWRHVFLLRVDGQVAGLALVYVLRERPVNPEDLTAMAEFFVMRKFRKQRVGATFAMMLFDRFPGRWRVSQLEQNTGAVVFWRKVIGEYTQGNYEDTTWESSSGMFRGMEQLFDVPPKAG
jgi:predicted acetyltransferase